MNESELVGFAISPRQQSLLSLSAQGIVSPFVAQIRLALKGVIDRQRLQRALESVVARHEILRTRFMMQPGLKDLLQVIMPRGQVTIREAGRSTTEEHPDGPIDPAAGDIVRALLLPGNELLLTLPSVCADAVSLRTIVRDMMDSYAHGATAGNTSSEVMQYADVAEHFNGLLLSDAGLLGRQYWHPLIKKAGRMQPARWKRGALPADFRPEVIHEQIPVEFLSKGIEIADKTANSAEAILLACWQALLQQVSGEAEVVVGYAADGRDRPEFEGCVGLFERYLPLETVSPDDSLMESCRRLHGTLEEAGHWQGFFQRSEEEKYCSICFSYYDAAWELNGDGLQVCCTGLNVCSDRFDLKLSCTSFSSAFGIDLWYDPAACSPMDARQLLSQYLVLVGNAVTAANVTVAGLSAVGPKERHRLLFEYNLPVFASAPQAGDIVHRIAGEAARDPKASAVIQGTRVLTYGELEKQSNQVARYLRQQGVGPEIGVAVCMERTPTVVVALLGILKAGGAYIPLEPSLPAERLAFMLKDSRAAALLSERRLAGQLPENGPPREYLDSGWEKIAKQSDEGVEDLTTEENLAYVIYTSGSTGRPKGVGVTRKGLNNYVNWACVAYECREGGRAPLCSSLGFDLSVTSLWPPLVSGGCVVAAPESPETMEWLAREWQESYELVKITPAHLRMLEELLPEGRAKVSKRLVIGGEALRWQELEYWRKHAPETRLINEYGPTETVVGSCVYEAGEEWEEEGGVPIGRPIANTQVFVLDAAMMMLPAGAKGELYIGGAGVARGYLHQPGLTAEKFVPNSFSQTGGDRMYRTGDLVRWRTDGRLEYLGRADEQVKLRGYRIEPDEIDSVLRQFPGIVQAVATLREDVPGKKRLVGYVVQENDRLPLDAIGLRNYLAERLPEYMIPSALIELREMPLTSNGKINRKALPVPKDDFEMPDSGPPKTMTEQLLAGIWEQVLKREGIGREANFFGLGGHSIMATQIVSRVRNRFQVDLPLRTLFEAPILAGLAVEIDRQLGTIHAAPALRIHPVSREQFFPLSYSQQRLWFMDQLAPESPAYNIPFGLLLRGELNFTALQQSLDEIVRRHEILRTTFPIMNGAPVQKIATDLQLQVGRIDAGHVPAERWDDETAKIARQQVEEPFHLSSGPLLRVNLLEFSEREHVLLVTMHHIISDGWSLGIMAKEFDLLYEAFAKESTRRPLLPTLEVQYADYAVWQREWLQGDVFEKQLFYWKQQLKEAPPLLELPTDRPRPAVSSYRGAREQIAIPAGLAASLRQLSRNEGVTLYMTLLAAFQALLSRYADQNDVIVGTTVAGRTEAETEPLIGLFVNTLALRTNVSQNPLFRDLLGQVREMLVGAYANQHLPFERLVAELGLERNLGYSPVFQVTFDYQNTPREDIVLHGLQAEWISISTHTSKYDLTVSFTDTQSELPGIIEYTPDLFGPSTIQRLARHFLSLLQTITVNPDLHASEALILTESERNQVLREWNNTDRAGLPEWTMHELFELQAQKTPDRPAAIFEGRQLTYRELDDRANQLANYLAELGVGPEVRVGICLERGLDMAVGLLGILKAGGVYVPLDPAHPPERLSYMLSDSGAVAVLTHERLLGKVSPAGIEAVYLDQDWVTIADPSNVRPNGGAAADNLAYVCYTSGSTGRPKGVAITHRGIVNYICWAVADYSVAEGRGTGLHSSLAVDMTLTSLLPLFVGLPVTFVPDTPGMDALIARLREEPGWSLLKLTPAHLTILNSQLTATEMAGVAHALVIGGENLTGDVALQWRDNAPKVRLVNEYGPTETVVGCCTYTIGSDTARDVSIPIGKPISNMRVYVLDRQGLPLPIGIRGEIFIGGVSLARGYLNRPDLTAEKFVPDPFSGNAGARLYRTGDQGRYLQDGNLEYLGRLDHQVKIRGFRVEPGEIEALLSAFDGIDSAIAMVREDWPGKKRLVAYLAAQSPVDTAEVVRFLRERLPEYMVPAAFIVMERFPLDSGGKVDRRTLPHPEVSFGEAQYTAPRTEEEHLLSEICASVLNVARIGIHDNFFGLGGDSILCIQVIARAREAGLHLTARQMFERQTIAELACVASRVNQNLRAEQGLLAGPVPLTPVQRAFFGWNLAVPEHYNHAALLRLHSDADIEFLEEALKGALKQHDALRMQFELNALGPRQFYGVTAEGVFERKTLAYLSEGEQSAALESHANLVQSGFDLQSPALVKAVVYDLGNERGRRLLLVIHHLLMDGVSWRILLSDLERGYQQLRRREPLVAAAKTTSYREWSESLERYSEQEELRQEIEYWCSDRYRHTCNLPIDDQLQAKDVNRHEAKRNVLVSLDQDETEILLHEATDANRGQVEDLLLTALVRVCIEWSGGDAVLIDMEGHGREELFPDVDLSRTVGWFTSIYPLLLRTTTPEEWEAGRWLREVRGQLRAVPNRGIGYGILRYLSSDVDVRGRLEEMPQPQISFNYFGQFDQVFRNSTLFQPAEESMGKTIASRNQRQHIVDVQAMIIGGKLQLNWSYCGLLHRPETIGRCADRCLESLRDLIVHCRGEAAKTYSASDFDLLNFTQKEFMQVAALLDE